MVCPTCGGEIEQGVNFCGACGTRLPQSATPGGPLARKRWIARHPVLTGIAVLFGFAVLIVAFAVMIGGMDEKVSSPTSPSSSDQQDASPVVADNDPLRLKIHDVFLANYVANPIRFGSRAGAKRREGSKGFEDDFVSNRYNTGFTVKDHTCAECYDFSASFYLLDQSGEQIYIKCYPMLDLATGSVVEWNPSCAKFFRAKGPMPAPRIRRTNNFIGLGEKSKQKMQEYMFAVGDKNVEDPSEFDNEQELPCPDFTHTCWHIVRQTTLRQF